MTTQSLPKTTVALRGAEVRRRRSELGKVTQSFADELLITRDYLYKLERGHRLRVSPALFDRIAAALGVSGDERQALIAGGAS